MIPDNLKYSQSHEWTALDIDEKTVTIGITDFAIGHLGDIVYLELPEPGDNISAGTSFGIIESVKAASDLNSPVTGEILAVNEALPDELDSLKDDAYDNGWMIKIAISDPSELDRLMDSAAYAEYLKTQDEEEEE